MMEYINKTINNNNPMYPSDGRVIMKVVTIILKFFALVINLSILKSLKILRIEVYPPIEGKSLVELSTISEVKVNEITKKSNLLKVSRKYFVPIHNNFKTASIQNMTKKIVFIVS